MTTKYFDLAIEQKLEIYMSAKSLPTEVIMLILKIISDILEDKNNDVPNFTIHGWSAFFNFETFPERDYPIRRKNEILRIIEKKYTDWNEMIPRKYEIMRFSFCESGKSKLYASMTNVSFELKYPTRMSNGNFQFTIIMCADGKGGTRYYQSIGKFNIVHRQ